MDEVDLSKVYGEEALPYVWKACLYLTSQLQCLPPRFTQVKALCLTVPYTM